MTQGMTCEAFIQDEKTQLAVIRCLEVIGEAAGALSGEYYEKHPTIPWRAIIGMRNRMVHAYFKVDLELCWRTVQEELPKLSKQIELLPEMKLD